LECQNQLKRLKSRLKDLISPIILFMQQRRSTPKSAENHAKQIKRNVDACEHQGEKDE
jgi:hypothetical protein